MGFASSQFAKRAADHVPYCKDQGIDYLCGAAKPGVSVQSFTYIFATGGVINFAALGLANMANTTYQVVTTNHTGSAVAKVSAKTAAGFTITGPTAGDSIDVAVIGCVNGQLSQ